MFGVAGEVGESLRGVEVGTHVEDGRRIDIETLVARVRALLSAHPEALVVACGADGLSRPVPASIGLNGQRILEGRSAVDYVVPGDLAEVIRGLEVALTTGEAKVQVRVSSGPDRWLDAYITDLRPAHGVVFAVLTVAGGAGAHAGLGEVQEPAPRYGTLRQNAVGVVLECDAAFTQMFGWSESEVVGRSAILRIHPDDQSRVVEGWMAMLDGGRPQQMRTRRGPQELPESHCVGPQPQYFNS